ncbi:MAG: nitroreductase family deazaflavin-dependent oxidoreductase [Actinomycetes bacterium]
MPLFSVDGPVGRRVQRIAGSRRFAPVAKHVIPRIDKGLHRLTNGRFVLSSLLVPSLVLTTTGAKSGQLRTTPLACMPEDDGAWVVVGSNFGQTKHPAWTANLLAHPDATVNFRGREVRVRARLLDGEERAATWARIVQVWPTYDRYIELSGGRDIRVFRLEPIG